MDEGCWGKKRNEVLLLRKAANQGSFFSLLVCSLLPPWETSSNIHAKSAPIILWATTSLPLFVIYDI
jgi:hypothetical protein